MSLSQRLLALGLAGVLLAGCSQSSQPTVEQSTTSEMTTAPSMAETTPAQTTPAQTVELNAQNKSGQTGTATFEDLGNGKTKVTLSLTGGTFTQPQPAHIHVGTCEKPGAVQYPLTDVIDGMSETTIDAAMSSLWTGEMLVNVHKSAKESSVYTSCGMLTATSPTQDGTTPASAAPAMQY